MRLYRTIETYHRGRKSKKKNIKPFVIGERKEESTKPSIPKEEPIEIEKQEVETHPKMREPRKKKKVGRALIIG